LQQISHVWRVEEDWAIPAILCEKRTEELDVAGHWTSRPPAVGVAVREGILDL
jgi:hypothetical protein